jgi:integrase
MSAKTDRPETMNATLTMSATLQAHLAARPVGLAAGMGGGLAATAGGGRGCMEVAKQPQPRKLTLGFVRLTLEGGRWKARFHDPETGGDIRRLLPVASEAEATQLAMEYNKALLGGRDMVPSWRQRKPESGLPIRKALVEAIRAGGGQESHKARQLKGTNAFMAFMSREYPDVAGWGEVRPSMVAAWVRELQESGRAYDTVRLLLAPVRHASRFWSLEDPDLYRDVAKLARVKLERTDPKAVHALDPEQAKALLAWLRVNNRPLWPLAVLAAMAGLRQLEAAAVRRADLDLDAGTVTVTKTALHAPKNRASYRTIPLHPEAVETLRTYLADSPVRDLDPEQPLFLSRTHQPWTMSALLQAWRRALRNMTLPAGFTAHHLRATFATLARRGGADSRYLQAFLGHSRGDVLGEHYERITTEDLRAKVVAAFATEWIGKVASERQQTGNADSGRVQAL